MVGRSYVGVMPKSSISSDPPLSTGFNTIHMFESGGPSSIASDDTIPDSPSLLMLTMSRLVLGGIARRAGLQSRVLSDGARE